MARAVMQTRVRLARLIATTPERSHAPAARPDGEVVQRRDDESGYSTLEFIIVTPALLLITFLVFQFALFFHARSVAESAAEEGAGAARRFDGTAAEGRTAAGRYLDQLASERLLQGRQVRVTRGGEQVQATVTGRVVSLVPGLYLDVRVSSSGPVERYVPPAGDAGGAQ